MYTTHRLNRPNTKQLDQLARSASELYTRTVVTGMRGRGRTGGEGVIQLLVGSEIR